MRTFETGPTPLQNVLLLLVAFLFKENQWCED